MHDGGAWLLVAAVGSVGVLHTMVPDHWVPVTLIARQRGWSRTETAWVALKAGVGHVLSTLAIALLIWLAGVAVATRFAQWVDTLASLALFGFGSWIGISAWRDLHVDGPPHQHSHSHGHAHAHAHATGGSLANPVHGPELQRLETESGPAELSIFEDGAPPRFRLTGAVSDSVRVETEWDDHRRQVFLFLNRGGYWESAEVIPEPHQFNVTVAIQKGRETGSYSARFTEHEHAHARHEHVQVIPEKTKSRTALLLILGSSPMVEGIPAFFAASKYGIGVIALMSLVFGATTIAAYVLLSVTSTMGLQRVSLGPLERYGEVLSGAFIALVGVAFWIWPVL